MTKAKQKTMQAAAIDRFGGIETITLQTLPVPEVGPDEVLIRVESAGVAVWDVFEREGGFAADVGNRAEVPLRAWHRRSGHGRRCRRAGQPLQGRRPGGMCCNFVVEPKVGVDDRKFSSSQRTDRE